MNIAEMIERLREARDAGGLDPETANKVIAILREMPLPVEEEELSTYMTGVCSRLAAHAIGMDNKSVYKVHGEKIYIPYRNYYTASMSVLEWEMLVERGRARRAEYEDRVEYKLTPEGIYWLANVKRINIAVTPD